MHHCIRASVDESVPELISVRRTDRQSESPGRFELQWGPAREDEPRQLWLVRTDLQRPLGVTVLETVSAELRRRRVPPPVERVEVLRFDDGWVINVYVDLEA